MKIHKELILNITLHGADVEVFVSAIVKSLASDKNSNQGIGFLHEEEKKVLKQFIDQMNKL